MRRRRVEAVAVRLRHTRGGLSLGHLGTERPPDGPPDEHGLYQYCRGRFDLLWLQTNDPPLM